jgi:hypothetical protein
MNLVRWCLPLLLLAVVGCGDGRVKLPTADVAGTVVYHGTPLAGGRIVFYHPSGQAAAVDLSNGAFSVVAYQGNNKVAVHCYRCLDNPNGPILGSPPPKPVKSLIPDRYTEFDSSGLTFEVKPGKNKAEFVLRD